MLHLFHMDVAKVDRGMLHMLQLFQRHVADESYGCCKSKSRDVAHVAYVANVSEACSKRFVRNVSFVPSRIVSSV